MERDERIKLVSEFEFPEWIIEAHKKDEQGEELPDGERYCVQLYESMRKGNYSAVTDFANRINEGEIPDEHSDPELALRLYKMSAEMGCNDAMSQHVKMLYDRELVEESLKFSFIYAHEALALIEKGKTNRSKVTELVKATLTTLNFAFKSNITIDFDFDQLNACYQKMADEGQIDAKTYQRIKDLNTEIELKNNPSAIKVAIDNFIDGGDFKVGQYASLWGPVKLVDAPFSEQLELLNKTFPWMQNVTNNIIRQIKAREHGKNQAFKIRNLLLVGLPGGGKSSYFLALSEIVGVPFRVVMAAGTTGSMTIKGVQRGYSSAQPGLVPRAIAQEKIANPLIMIDELDKCSPSSHNGSFHDALLQLLEPSTSKNYYDDCLEARLDLSHANYVATANSLLTIPKPLLSRFEVILAGEPDVEGYKKAIAYSRVGYAKELGLDVRMLPDFDNYDINTMIERCKSLREISRVARSILEHRIVGAKSSFH